MFNTCFFVFLAVIVCIAIPIKYIHWVISNEEE